MTTGMFVLYDEKAQVWSQNPWYSPNNVSATRDFEQIVNNPESRIYPFRLDYSLWRVGSYNSLTGKVKGENPTIVCQAIDVIKHEPEAPLFDRPALVETPEQEN